MIMPSIRIAALSALLVLSFAPPPALAASADGDVVVFRRDDGSPILPDLDAARRQKRGAVRAGNELAFTFNSPTYPWTPTELTELGDAIDAFYPVAKDVYGEPAFSITVNVRKDPTISYAGLYFPSINEMVLRGTADLSVLCHEMIHAFRDDSIVGLSSYEEGMTRAAEVEVFARLAAYEHPFDEHHSYPYDVYYEAMNRPEIGAKNGNFFYGYVAALVRYQLAGYAWGKALLETPSFFVDFNAALYAAVLADPGAASDESGLVGMAAAASPTVEGEAFGDWYGAQGVLDTSPPEGYFLYQRINQYTIDFFRRIDLGNELMQASATIDWEVYDHAGTLLDSGTEVTGGNGFVSIAPALPPAYQGRIAVVAAADSPDGPVASTAYRTAVEGSGVFGVIRGADSGSVEITPLDDPGSAVVVPVVDGAFYAPSLEAVAGRFSAVFSGSGGETAGARFNKSASRYFASLVVPACGNEVLDDGEDCDDGNALEGDGCDSNCTFSGCANAIAAPDEECDDGNLGDGDGCASDCTSELSAGGSLASECLLEWLLDPVPPVAAGGLPANAQTCTDGESGCDFGAAGDGACTFRVSLCLDVDERRFECADQAVDRIRLDRPRQDRPKTSEDEANRDAIEAALQAVGGEVRGECRKPRASKGQLCQSDADCDSAPAAADGSCKGRFVAFDPPLAASTLCTAAADVDVTLRPAGNSVASQLKVRAIPYVEPGSGLRAKPDKDRIKLVCVRGA